MLFLSNERLVTGIDGVHLTKESNQLLANKLHSKIKELLRHKNRDEIFEIPFSVIKPLERPNVPRPPIKAA